MTATAAKRLVACYALRWGIEMLFRILKSGCRVEQRQVLRLLLCPAFARVAVTAAAP